MPHLVWSCNVHGHTPSQTETAQIPQ